jgi:uncharacterized iron-regulated protein
MHVMCGFLLVLMAMLAQQPAGAAASPAHAGTTVVHYVPERVYDTAKKFFSDFEAMLADVAAADIVLIGEQHDDANTHRLEAAVLQGLLRRGRAVTVSLEMFERDVQAELDDYLAGRKAEEQFLAASRPWPRYATDYKPLVELARAHGWGVIASNVPRKYASLVAKNGLDAVKTLSDAERALVAKDLHCPIDSYYERFSQVMNQHPAPGAEKQTDDERRAVTERYYFAQCVKDETMAESIVAALHKLEGKPGTIVHYNGAFHTDFGAGVAERVRRRLPDRRIALITMLPVDNIDTVQPEGDELTRAQYLVYTVK